MTLEAKDQWFNMTLIGDDVAEVTIGDTRITVSMKHKWTGESWQSRPIDMAEIRPRIRIAPYVAPPPPPPPQPRNKIPVQEPKKS